MPSVLWLLVSAARWLTARADGAIEFLFTTADWSILVANEPAFGFFEKTGRDSDLDRDPGLCGRLWERCS